MQPETLVRKYWNISLNFFFLKRERGRKEGRTEQRKEGWKKGKNQKTGECKNIEKKHYVHCYTGFVAPWLHEAVLKPFTHYYCVHTTVVKVSAGEGG